MKVTIQVNISVNGKEVVKEEVSQSTTSPQFATGGGGITLCGPFSDGFASPGGGRGIQTFASPKGKFQSDGGTLTWKDFENGQGTVTKCCEPGTENDCGVWDDEDYDDDLEEEEAQAEKSGKPIYSDLQAFIGTDARTPDVVLCKERNLTLKAPVKASNSNFAFYPDSVLGESNKIPLTYAEARFLEVVHAAAGQRKKLTHVEIAKRIPCELKSLPTLKYSVCEKFAKDGVYPDPIISGRGHYLLNPDYEV